MYKYVRIYVSHLACTPLPCYFSASAKLYDAPPGEKHTGPSRKLCRLVYARHAALKARTGPRLLQRLLSLQLTVTENFIPPTPTSQLL